jgi:hypothetical protein
MAEMWGRDQGNPRGASCRQEFIQPVDGVLRNAGEHRGTRRRAQYNAAAFARSDSFATTPRSCCLVAAEKSICGGYVRLYITAVMHWR